MSNENRFYEMSLYKNYSTTQEFFTEIIENWNLALESILIVGGLLVLAKGKLGTDYKKLQMQLNVQGIPSSVQNKCLNVAQCQHLIKYCQKEYEKGTKPLLPNDIKVLNEIATVTKDNASMFRDGLNQGIIGSQTTSRDLVSLFPPKNITPKPLSPKKPNGVLVCSIGVKKDKIKDAKQATEIQKALDDAIKSVVSQFPEICDYNLIQIPKIL
jgi:hypothetical protein